MWLFNPYLSPTWARWQLQGFQAGRGCSSTSTIICGDHCHACMHTRMTIPLTPSICKARNSARTHTSTHTLTLPPPQSPCCSSLTEQANPAAWQTDSQTYHYPSLSIRVCCLTIAGLRTTAFNPMILKHNSLHTNKCPDTYTFCLCASFSSPFTTCNIR